MGSLVLNEQTAAELMTPSPASISENAAILDAASVLNNRDFSALAVVNDAGRLVGVVSRTDIVRRPAGKTDVREIMTAPVLSVRAEDPAWEVVAKMAAHKVHRPFVVNRTGALTGVISAIDIVRKLRRMS